MVHDGTLINAWGLAFSPGGPAWISANGSGTSNIYRKDGSTPRPSVTIPSPDPTSASAPTGQVLNTDAKSLRGDVFISATEDGTVAGWQPADGSTAVQQFALTDAVFKGLALARVHGKLRVYVADFHHNQVVVLDDDYQPITLRRDQFVDPKLPAGFAPFNIITDRGLLLVSYAKQDADAHDDVAGLGNGYVNVFEPDGDFVGRLISAGQLDSPWGMEVMPPSKGHREARLLVGNFGNGRINVYELERHDGRRLGAEFEGALGDKPHHPISIPGLWAIEFGSGVGDFDVEDIYFTAGPATTGTTELEQEGLFGELSFD
jgi:uncharacterized protein (TIGR03118 family)